MIRSVTPDLSTATAEERIRWAFGEFGDGLILSTSFGVQAAVMLHLATRVMPRIPVVFIDTGYHFPETYRFAQELTKRLQLNLRVYNPLQTAARQEALYGKRWEQGLAGLHAYNLDNKVEPMDRAVRELGATAWLAGLRRVQATTREALGVVQVQNKTTKIHPILDWDNRAVHRYLTHTTCLTTHFGIRAMFPSATGTAARPCSPARARRTRVSAG